MFEKLKKFFVQEDNQEVELFEMSEMPIDISEESFISGLKLAGADNGEPEMDKI